MKILFRVDATQSGGTGHISRCLALAEEFLRQGNKVFILGFTDEVPWIRTRICELALEHLHCKRAEIPDSLIGEISPDLVIFDSYEFDVDSINLISKNFPTVAIVDENTTKIIADIYVNQNLGADEVNFVTPNSIQGQHFLGAKFALIRESLIRVRSEYKLRSSSQPVVTCFLGGSKFSDKIYEISRLLGSLNSGPKFNFVVENSQRLRVSEYMKNHDLTFHLPSPNLDKILLRSDAVVCGAGTSVLEMHCVGLPTAFVPVAKNQLANIRKIMDNDSGMLLCEDPNMEIDLKKIDELESLLYDKNVRNRFFNNSRLLVDGMGKNRLVDFLTNNSNN